MGESVSQELVDRIAEAVIRKLDEREKISAIAREVVLMLAERQPIPNLPRRRWARQNPRAAAQGMQPANRRAHG